MFRYYKVLQQTSYSPSQTLVYKKEEMSREEAYSLLSEEKLKEIEEDLRQSALSAPQFSISAQIYIKDINENTAEYIVITYYPLDLFITEKLQPMFPKSRLSEKLPIILSASHLTVIDKKRYIQLVAYTKNKKIPVLTTTKKSAIPVLKDLVRLHKEFKS